MTNYEELAKLAEAARDSGDWFCIDRTVYALEHHGWRKGEELFRNRFSFTVQRGPDFDENACAKLATFCAAANPAAILALLSERTQLAERVASLEDEVGDLHDALIDAKSARATPPQPVEAAKGGEPVTRLDVMSLIRSHINRAWTAGYEKSSDIDAKYMTEIEDAITGIYHGRYIAGYDLRKSEDALLATPPAPTVAPSEVTASDLHDAIMRLSRRVVAVDYSKQELRAYNEGHRDARHDAAELAAQAAAAPVMAVPEGWKLVPIRPTDAMREAAAMADDEGFEAGRSHGASSIEIYDAMLEAAPSPAAPTTEGGDHAE